MCCVCVTVDTWREQFGEHGPWGRQLLGCSDSEEETTLWVEVKFTWVLSSHFSTVGGGVAP